MKPRHARALEQIIGQLQRGQLIQAIDALDRFIADCPGELAPYLYLAQALRALGRTAKAITHLQATVKIFPNVAEFRHELAINFFIAGQMRAAADQFAALAALAPAHDAPWAGLGEGLVPEKYIMAAARAFDHAHQLAPGNWHYSNNAAAAWVALGDYDRAILLAQSALDQAPNQLDCLLTMGNALVGAGQLDQAISYLARAVQNKPDHLKARIDLIDAQIRALRFEQAYNQIQAFDPTSLPPEICNKRAELFDRVGMIDKSLADYRAILAPPIEGTRPVALMNYLAALSKADEPSALSIKPEMSRILAAIPLQEEAKLAPLQPRDKIRLGFVSADFRQHPVARNISPLLSQRNRQDFDLILYSDVTRPDSQTGIFEHWADRMRRTAALSDSELASLIRSDGIDILVILAGRMDNNRLLLARRRAAPIQISFHDLATSGVENMDYLIADPILVPKGSPEPFVETIIRLPTFYTHEPLQDAPEPGPLPMLGNGYVTFGSFSNPSKITDHVLDLWVKTLAAVPNSRLKLKYLTHYADPFLRQRFINAFGPMAARLDFNGAQSTSQHEHLSLYRDIDLTLDTFPFCGSTTTFESLSMGVPVVTLALAPMISRWSSAMLTKLDLKAFIATTPDEFVNIARRFAGSCDVLAALRQQLPGRVASSPLCRTGARARQLERIFKALYRRHISQTVPDKNSIPARAIQQ